MSSDQSAVTLSVTNNIEFENEYEESNYTLLYSLYPHSHPRSPTLLSLNPGRHVSSKEPAVKLAVNEKLKFKNSDEDNLYPYTTIYSRPTLNHHPFIR